jgi:glycerate-2-kinase
LRGFEVARWPEQIECDVETAAQQLAAAVAELKRGQLLVAGGEPTVVVRGGGQGGRCTELAVRFCVAAGASPAGRWPGAATATLFASSDGVDGNSGAAGVEIDRVPDGLDRDLIETELRNSNSSAAAFAIGRAIMIPSAGNNLRDLYLLARR